MDQRWNRFFRQFQKDFRLWLFFMAGLSLYRIVFILVFHSEIDTNRIVANTIAALANGLRFDIMVSTYWILVPIVASILCGFWDLETAANRLRAVCGGVFLCATIAISIVSVEYYREYHDVFNQLLFHIGDDDTAAIFSTIYADYNVFPYLFLAMALFAIGLVIRKRYFSAEFIPERLFGKYMVTHWRRMAASLAIAGLVFMGTRGSIGYRPVQVKDSGITSDRLLNKSVLNPYIALIEAVNIHRDVLSSNGLKTFLPDENISAAIQEAFPRAASAASVDRVLERTAAGPRMKPPRHIFLMFMESYDAWPMLDKYAGLGLVDNGRRMAREGLSLKAFLPAGNITIDSYASLIIGMPFTMLQVNHEPAGRRPLPTSLPETFRRLGYRTRFFDSGYLSWQDVGDFSSNQGFDEVYGAGHTAPGAIANEWGVADQYIFDLVEKIATDDRPSFNFIMTTTYHPPYNFDLKALGVPLPTVPPELEAEFAGDRSKMLNILGHLRYADRSMGNFVKRTESRLPQSLFVLTGDHYGRRFINPNPTTFESSAVPLVLYGKEVLRGVKLPEKAAGSHTDIASTLIEAVAPKGFKYWAIGHNLLEEREGAIGYSTSRIIGPDFLMELWPVAQFSPIPGRPLPEILPSANDLLHQVQRLQGIAWWRIRKGSDVQREEILASRPARQTQLK